MGFSVVDVGSKAAAGRKEQILGSGRSGGGGGKCGELTSAEKSRDWRGINFGDLEKSRGISANYPLLRGGVINLISPVVQ